MRSSIVVVQWIEYMSNSLRLELGAEVRLERASGANVLDVSTIPKKDSQHS